MKPRVCNFEQMKEAEQLEFIEFVHKGGQVNAHSLPGLVRHALALVTLHDGDTLIGTAAVKNPNEEHHNGDFKKAGVAELANSYPLEIGWIVVHSDHRHKGHSRTVMAAAVGAAGGSATYVTTLSDAIKRILPDYGFSVLGQSFPSSQVEGGSLTLFVRPAPLSRRS